MSKSLVRTSLELFGYENDSKGDGTKRRKAKSKGTLDLVPRNHRLVTKKNKKEISIGVKKLNIHEAKKRLAARVDPTEENVRLLLSLGGTKLNSDTSDKLLTRAVDKTRAAKEKEQQEESTAFTEEDFKKFEKEYCEL